jgi:hypothetical protein
MTLLVLLQTAPFAAHHVQRVLLGRASKLLAQASALSIAPARTVSQEPSTPGLVQTLKAAAFYAQA